MKKLFFITACLLTLLFTSCNKEVSDNFTVYPTNPLNDTVWTKTVSISASVNELFDMLTPVTVIDSFEAANGASFHFGDTLAVEFKPNSCVTSTGASTPATGLLRFEAVLLRTKGDFIKFFKPTTTESGSILESGGGLFIRVTKDGKELSLAQGSTVKLRFPDVDGAKLKMQGFYGKETIPVLTKGIDTAFNWVADTDITPLTTWSKPSTNPLIPSYYGYEMNAKNLRWISAERYLDSSLPKTKVTAVLSPNFTNKNTAVFAVFTNQKAVVNLKGDYPSRSFYANNIPLGAAVKLISVSKIGDDFYLGVENISSVATVTRYTLKPEKKSLKDVMTSLNSL